MNIRHLQNCGTRIAFQTFGPAGQDPVVLIMGATASMLGWPDALCQGLADAGHEVVRYDHRDTGESTTSPPGPPSYTVEDLLGDLIAVMEGCGMRRAHLVGMSLGGYVAQMAALQHPDRVRSLTLIGAEPLGWDGAPLPHIAPVFMSHFASMESLDWSNTEAVKAFLLEIERLCAGSRYPFDAAVAEQRVGAVVERALNIQSAFNHGMVQPAQDWQGRFRSIRQPTLVVHGQEDPILPLANGEAIAAGIAGARLVVLEGVGHELPEPALPHIVETIATFLRAH